MKIIIEGDANEFAALVNEIDGTNTIEPDTDEIIAAFKKMTLARIKRLETSMGQDHCEVNAVRQCVEFITALELDDDSKCAAI